MKPSVVTGGDRDTSPVPEGVYNCVIRAYKIVDNPFYKDRPYVTDKAVTIGGKVYQPGDEVPADPEWMKQQFQFVFEIEDGEHKGKWLFKRTSMLLSKNTRNNLYKIFSKVLPQAYLDELIDKGDAPDIDTEIIGKRIRVMAEVVNGRKGPANKVTGFMAAV